MGDDERLRQAYAAASMTAVADHPAVEQWERLAMGELPPGERDALFDHVARCAECAEVYRGLRQLEKEARAFDPAVPKASVVPHRPRQAWYVGLAAAAVLILAFLLPRAGLWPPADDTLRSNPTIAPVPVAPLGSVEGKPEAFRWEGVKGADRYRVDAFSADGEIQWTSPDVTGLSVPWPDQLPAVAGAVYYWKITAVPGPDRRVLRGVSESPLVSVEFPAVP